MFKILNKKNNLYRFGASKMVLWVTENEASVYTKSEALSLINGVFSRNNLVMVEVK